MSQIHTVDDILKKLRSGNRQDLRIKYGDYEFECRLLSASEERAAIASARSGVKVIHEGSRDLDESLAVMKAVLIRACTVNSTPHLPQSVVDQLTNIEIQSLYDQYLTLCNTVNPEFETFSQEEIIGLIQEVKKKRQSASALFTWQLAAIGKFFLDVYLPMVKEPGS